MKRLLILVSLAGLLVVGGAARGTTNGTAEVSTSISEQIQGNWQGVWTTTRDGGDSGPLKCTVVPLTNGTYNARFRATYKGFIPFVHSVELHASRSNGQVVVTGTAKLADWAGGNYIYKGKISGDAFICTYKSESDEGVFDLKRAK